MTAIRIVTLLIGLVTTGEALALLVGMHFLSGQDNPWLTNRNNLLLVLDLLLGVGILILYWINAPGLSSLLVTGTLLGIITHGYRDVEYLTGMPQPFCLNVPLFMVNNLKLAGWLALLILMI